MKVICNNKPTIPSARGLRTKPNTTSIIMLKILHCTTRGLWLLLFALLVACGGKESGQASGTKVSRDASTEVLNPNSEVQGPNPEVAKLGGPSWNVGDWWILEVQSNNRVLSSSTVHLKGTWMEKTRYRYEVRDLVTLNGEPHYVVDIKGISEPIYPDKYTFWYRQKDLRVTKYYYGLQAGIKYATPKLNKGLRSAKMVNQGDFPYLGDSGMHTPTSIPNFGKNHDAGSQPAGPSQSTKEINEASILPKASEKVRTKLTQTSAPTFEYKLTIGNGGFTQYWNKELPWCWYGERFNSNGVNSRYRLVDFGTRNDSTDSRIAMEGASVKVSGPKAKVVKMGGPSWKIGDWWILEVQSTNPGFRDEAHLRGTWMEKIRYRYQVRDSVILNGEPSYVVDIEGISESKYAENYTFWYRQKDLRVIKYCLKKRCKETVSYGQGDIPFLGNVGNTIPNFGDNHDFAPHPTKLSQSTKEIDKASVLPIVSEKVRTKLAKTSTPNFKFKLILGWTEITQYWNPEFPWCLYGERASGNKVNKRYQLVDFGTKDGKGE